MKFGILLAINAYNPAFLDEAFGCEPRYSFNDEPENRFNDCSSTNFLFGAFVAAAEMVVSAPPHRAGQVLLGIWQFSVLTRITKPPSLFVKTGSLLVVVGHRKTKQNKTKQKINNKNSNVSSSWYIRAVGTFV